MYKGMTKTKRTVTVYSDTIGTMEERFDEKFKPIDFCNSGENKMSYVEQTIYEIKQFIHSEISHAREEEKRAWLSGLRCENCGRDKEAIDGLNLMCKKCYEEG